MPTSPTTRSAKRSLTKFAGRPGCNFCPNFRRDVYLWPLTTQHLSLPPVPAKVLVVRKSALTRVGTTSAERSRSVLTRACATESVLSAPRPSPKPTSPPATERHKSASTGSVARGFTLFTQSGCHSDVTLKAAIAWSHLSSRSSPTGLLRLHLWKVRARGVHLRQPRWQGRNGALPRVLHGEEWVTDTFSQLHNYLFFCFRLGLCHSNSFNCLRCLSLVNPNTCSSTGSEILARFFNKKVTTLPAGSPCNDFKGYCDVFMKCRLVDADGPLARLKKAIFNPELYENIAEWIVVCVDLWIRILISYWLLLCEVMCIDCVWLCSFSSPGSLVGSVVDGHCPHHAHGWIY